MLPESRLLVENLSVSFLKSESKVVRNFSFSLNKGETLAIVGESGSGKSLTALSLIGLLPLSAKWIGNIFLRSSDEKVVQLQTENDWEHLRGKEIGIVFQEPMNALNPIMKIGEQLVESIQKHQPLSAPHAKKNSLDWLTKVQLPLPEQIWHRYPHELSGGQRQRVMIAMAMCNNPSLLIADEPTTALDATVQKEIIALIKDLQAQTGASLIFITHDLALAASIATNVAVMFQGECVEWGSAQKIFHAPAHPYTQALMDCRPSLEHKGKPLPTVADLLNPPTVLNQNETKSPHTEMTDIESEEPLLQVKGMKVWFPSGKSWNRQTKNHFKAVEDVSFSLRRGEVLGLVGESGCGKSTISRTLLGLTPLQSGQIFFEGKDLAFQSQNEWRETRRHIQLIFQDPFSSLNPRMTVGEMLMEPLRVHQIVPQQELKNEALRLLSLVQLPPESLTRYPHQFSGGQRQRLGIARALAVRPKLLICDESVSALDVSVQAQILNLLKKLQSQLGLSYLFISHDLSIVYYISDSVMVMRTGKIVEKGSAFEVLQHPKDPYTESLVAAIPKL
ncbi:MAG: ABC transporter ATP-binding protein [Bacteroidetes bacterium]|nr:ABC transporter ATP-binding protein [Bacteroidota bacterium]